MGRFKKGFFLGGLLGAGLVWLNFTKKGRETRKKLMAASSEIYSDVVEKLEESGAKEKVNKNKYVKLVRKKVDKYTDKHPWAEDMEDMLVKLVSSQWDKAKKEMKKQKDKK